MSRRSILRFHAPRRRQRGAVLALFTIAMVVMLAMAGMALDGAHGMLNKTRLQNVVDAAALSAARTLLKTEDEVLAEAEALQKFAQNANAPGNREMAEGYAGGGIDVSVAFSSTLHPFVPGSTPAQYVRVTATNFTLPGWFIRVMGFNEKVVGASAVAGPSPTIQTACNLTPMMVCGDPNAAPEDFFGYEIGQADVLKTSTSSFEVGPGNFQLIRLGDGQGGADIRQGMAGNYAGCISSDDTVPTEPGNTVGPVAQGLNTRFGEYQGGQVNSTDHPPDIITWEPETLLSYDSETDTIYQGSEALGADNDPDFHAEYEQRASGPPYDHAPIEMGGIGVKGRRVLAVTIGDCSETTNGQGDVPVLGFLCYYLIQRAQQKGNESHVYGQFIEDGCDITGRPGAAPTTGPGPYIIQLYKDETAEAS